MSREAFLQELLVPGREFCRTHDNYPTAYSYSPLSSDGERIRVMKSRLFNELLAADRFGAWVKTMLELDVKAIMAEPAHKEMTNEQLLSKRIRDLGARLLRAQRTRAPLVAERPVFPRSWWCFGRRA